MIKFIVSGADGTLVQDGLPSVNPQVFDAILKLHEEGIQSIIASGRLRASVEYTFESAKRKISYVADNKAYVGCCGRSPYVCSIEPGIVHRTIRKVRRYPDLEVVYAGANRDCIEPPNKESSRWLTEGYKFNLTRVDDPLELDESCVRVSIYKPGGIEAATEDTYEESKDELKVARVGDMWMDCMVKGVNKEKTIETIQGSLGIRPEGIMALGDQPNDIEMLGRAHYSFAVVNVREEVGKAARFQADSNKNGGALGISKHLLRKRFFIGRK